MWRVTRARWLFVKRASPDQDTDGFRVVVVALVPMIELRSLLSQQRRTCPPGWWDGAWEIQLRTVVKKRSKTRTETMIDCHTCFCSVRFMFSSVDLRDRRCYSLLDVGWRRWRDKYWMNRLWWRLYFFPYRGWGSLFQWTIYCHTVTIELDLDRCGSAFKSITQL